MDGQPGIYMASKAKHGPRWRALREDGWPIVSTWIDESEVGKTTDWSDLWARSIREASSAGALIAYHEAGEVMKGALVEMGAALSHGRPVLWVGLDKGYTSWRHPNVIPCGSLQEALDRCERFGIRRGTKVVDEETEATLRQVRDMRAQHDGHSYDPTCPFCTGLIT